jgi:hypothetical protein
VLYGGSRVGKTEWVRSLGRHTYWQGVIDPKRWDAQARYVVVDDVPFRFLNAWKQILGKKNGWTMLEAFQEYLTVDRGGIMYNVL